MSGHPYNLKELYDLLVLTDAVKQRIIAKESEQQYPLDRLSDMRALINYSQHFIAQLVLTWDILTNVLHQPLAISTARLVRIHMACLIAISVAECLGQSVPVEWLQVLDDLNKQLRIRLEAFPHIEAVTPTLEPIPIPISETVSSSTAHRIYLKTRELADRLALGEHPIYSLAPCDRENHPKVIRQALFYQRTHPTFAHQILIGMAIDDNRYTPRINPFRGVLEDAIPTDARIYWEVFKDETPIYASTDLLELEQEVSVALTDVTSQQRSITQTEQLELRKMQIYSIEIREAFQYRGSVWEMPQEASEDVVKNRICQRLGLPRVGNRYAEAFLKLVERGIDIVEGML